MKKRSLWIVLGSVGVLAFVWLLARQGDAADGGRGPGGWGGGFGGPRAPAVVTVAPVTRGEFLAESEYVGALSADNAAELTARTPGQIVALEADTGDRVRRGQVLARIDPADERQRLEQARANARMSEATLEQRRSALRIAEKTADRTRSLFEQELIAAQQRDTVDAEEEGARAQVRLAEAQLEQARAAVSAAEVALEQTRIVAPFDGWVGKRHVDLGASANVNDPVFTLVDLDTVELEVPISERDAARVRVGQPAEVTVGAYPERTFPGRVARIASIFDPETHTAETEIEIANPDGVLKPGMFATARIVLDERPSALLVPREAVIEDGRDTWVLVAERDLPGAGAGGGRDGAAGRPGGPPGGRRAAGRPGGARGGPSGGDGAPGGPTYRVRRVAVDLLGTGAETGERVAIAGDVEAGDRVITLGHEDLADGAPVTLASPEDAGQRPRVEAPGLGGVEIVPEEGAAGERGRGGRRPRPEAGAGGGPPSAAPGGRDGGERGNR